MNTFVKIKGKTFLGNQVFIAYSGTELQSQKDCLYLFYDPQSNLILNPKFKYSHCKQPDNMINVLQHCWYKKYIFVYKFV